MTDGIREEIRIRFLKEDLNQAEIAEEIGVTRGYLNAALRGKKAGMPSVWERLFDFLGYELVAVPKEKVSDVKKMLVD